MGFSLNISWGKKEQRTGSVEDPTVPISSQNLVSTFSSESTSGFDITKETALTFSAVYASVALLSDMIASIPLNVYIKTDKGKFIDTGNSLYPILHDQPCDMYTSYDWRQLMETSAALWGNGYSKIIRDKKYRVVWLDFVHPEIVEPYQVILPDGRKRLKYKIKPAVGPEEIVDQDDMLHIKWMSTDGIKGLSPIEIAQNQIGLGLANEQFGAEFFKNGTSLSGVLTSDKNLTPDQIKSISGQWNDRNQGTSNRNKTPLLPFGIDFKPISIPPEQAQWIASRTFQLEEIARIFRIPLHMLASLSKSTMNNIEHQGIEFVVNTMRPRAVRWEMELNRKLLLESEKKDHYTKFNLDGLLRGDSTSRGSYLSQMTGMGIYTRNEAREYEDMNPLDGLDEPLTPANLQNQQAKDLSNGQA